MVTSSRGGHRSPVGDAGAFAAEDDRGRRAEVDARQRCAAARHGGDEPCTSRPPRHGSTSASVPRAPTGSRNVPPIAPRSAFQPNGFADPSTATTPVAPQAAAARTIAPTLPGSCSPARTSTSGLGLTPMARRSCHALQKMQPPAWTVRARDGDDAGRVLDGADRGEHLIGDGEDRDRRATRGLRERALSASVRSARARSAKAATSIGTPRRERFLHQVRAVEQDLTGRRAAGRARESRKRLTIAFCRLADPFHPLLLFSIPFLLPWPS